MSKIKDVAKKSKVITKLYNSFIRNSKKDAIEEVVHDYYKELAGKKIILVGHSGGLGGAEVLLRNMIQEFVRQKYQVVVLVRGNGPIIESYQKYAPTFVIDTVEKNVDYIQRLKRLGYNSAILNTITNGDLIPLCKQNDIHVVQLIHELPGVIHALKCEERAEIIATQADLVVFPANFVKEKFETIAPLKVPFKVKPQGLYMVYNNWNKSESRNYLKQQYNIPLDHFIVLNVGLGERRKGFDLFVEIADRMKQEKITFLWLGDVNEELKSQLSKKMEGLSNLVLPGYVCEKETFMKFYDGSDMFLLTSREDPFPSVVLESFNARRPVVAFKDAGGFQDIVQTDKSGYLVEYENVDAMIEKIRVLKEDDKLRETLGENAKKLSDEHRFVNYIKTLADECK